MNADIAVVGGGASGMMAALCAARRLPGARITVLERMNRVGKKLAATGNGRCNLTNTRALEGGYHGSVDAARAVIGRFPPERVMRFFDSIGVCPRVEEDGRVYPQSDQASSVLDALRLSLEEAGVAEVVEFELTDLKPDGAGFVLTARDGRIVRARRVVMATGGLTAPNLGGSATGHDILTALGHRLVTPRPSLVQIKTEPVRALKGIKINGGAAVEVGGAVVGREAGEVLFTEYGLSGPPILMLSRAVSAAGGKEAFVRLSVLPFSNEEALALLKARRQALAARPIEHFLTGLLNKRVGQTLIKLACPGEAAGLFARPSASISDDALARLAHLTVDWRLRAVGTQGFAQAQATAGGISAADWDWGTMASRRVRGLYLAGEALDVDGDCGGYNLQWAWASGMLAGECCAQSLAEGVAP